jgi:hypothetical protein
LLFISLFKSFDKFDEFIVYDANLHIYFYIASDILKKVEKVVLALAHIYNAHQWVQCHKPAVAVEPFDAVEYDDLIFHAAKVGQ